MPNGAAPEHLEFLIGVIGLGLSEHISTALDSIQIFNPAAISVMKIVETCENTAGKVAHVRHLEIGSYWFLQGMKRLGQFRKGGRPSVAKTLSGA